MPGVQQAWTAGTAEREPNAEVLARAARGERADGATAKRRPEPADDERRRNPRAPVDGEKSTETRERRDVEARAAVPASAVACRLRRERDGR
jgi:hypothetical protein